MTTVSLETARLLKEVGWKKPTHLIWLYVHTLGCYSQEWYKEPLPKLNVDTDYYAPTLEEILEELLKGEWNLSQITDDNGNFGYFIESYPLESIHPNSAVEAAAELWIKLKQK